MSEPTGTLTFRDLIIETARKIGVADYGTSGDGVVGVPTDPHDLNECKRHVNNAIRKFISDAPKNGWRWTRPVASVVIWGTVNANTANPITAAAYDITDDKTLVTVTSDTFYPTMEQKSISFTDITTGSFVITDYVSATQVKVRGNAEAAFGSAKTFSITSDGNFTLPVTFAGEVTGPVTYAAGTNQGIGIDWSDESTIRRWRQDADSETGDPYWAAIRPKAVSDSSRRRWELLMYPQPDDVLTVEFPYVLYFDRLVDLDDVHPAPPSHDETIKAACLAVVEKDVEGVLGIDWQTYKEDALPHSYDIDARSAPRSLGYFGNPQAGSRGRAIREFRQSIYDRPNVTFNE